MRIGDVMSIVAKDIDYYRNSGGGVTFSGGEALLQPEGLTALLEASRNLSIKTAIETCGHVPWENIARTEPLTDLFLFDLKHTDREKLKRVTGGNVDLILDNLHRLSESGKVILRIPCIPGFNLDKASLSDIFDVTCRLAIEEVHLLPYHTLGMDKYLQVGRRYTEGGKSLPKEALEEFAEMGRGMGLHICIGG
jgi:pyruvate formate lyase activating enzyme